MAATEQIHINFTGGIVSPGYLKEVLEIAANATVKQVRFGLRQQMIIDVPVKYSTSFTAACVEKNISYVKRQQDWPNIMSSYVATDIFSTDSWLREGVYKDIFNQFASASLIKVNICDRSQQFVPFFTGHVNWVASSSLHFWYLYVRLPGKEQVIPYQQLVYTNDIAIVTKSLEKILLNASASSVTEVFQQLENAISFISKPVEKELESQRFALPYYEGFNQQNNHYWLGIYRREEVFPTAFLIELCNVCMQTKIGQIYTTPWKSIIVKNIEPRHREAWDYILGKYRINVRHAANELNWQVEDSSEEGLQIKRLIIRHFDKEDVRTYGLSFAIKTRATSSLIGSVIIQKQEVKNPSRLKALERFEILYKAGFNPNESALISFRKDIEKQYLGIYLVSLCKLFYEKGSNNFVLQEKVTKPESETEKHHSGKIIYQCSCCLNVYDAAQGDIENNISVDTEFDSLPDSYCCSLCGAGKEEFKSIKEADLQFVTV